MPHLPPQAQAAQVTTPGTIRRQGVTSKVRPDRRLGRKFFARPTLDVARDLIGRRLVRLHRSRRLSGRIVEVEAYVGAADSACHGRSGVTARNRVLFGPAGTIYVYFSYGLHHLVNLVTEEEGFPAAVLIRALEPEEGIPAMVRHRCGPGRQRHPPANLNGPWVAGGPARLCQALQVDLRLNWVDISAQEKIFLEEGTPVSPDAIQATPRIGIDYARPRDRSAPWRFIQRHHPCLSRRA